MTQTQFVIGLRVPLRPFVHILFLLAPTRILTVTQPHTEVCMACLKYTLHHTPFPCMGLMEGVNIMSVPLRAFCRKY